MKGSKLFDPSELSFNEWREFMALFIKTNGSSGAAWDLMTCLRGPDSPSERGDMSSEEAATAYAGRRARKGE